VSGFTGEGDQVVQALSSYSLMSAYAAKRNDGSLSVLLINKSATNTLNAAVSLSGFTPQQTATVLSYGIPQDEAARTGVGSPDLAVSTISGISNSFVYALAPYSAAVIKLSSVSCPASVSPATQTFPYTGGNGQIAITAGPSCNWAATTTANWVVFSSGVSGSGNGVVSYSVQENLTGLPRQAVISIGSQTVTIVQDTVATNCTSSISPSFASFPRGGGTGSVSVTVGDSCAWQAVSNASWITITSQATGIGSGTVSYRVASNTSGRRNGTITIAGQTFSLKQK
jgi:hypothetical protein